MSNILPIAGRIKISDLAEWNEIDVDAMIASLVQSHVPIFKAGKKKASWSVRLEDIDREPKASA